MKYLAQFLKEEKKMIFLIILAAGMQVYGTLMVPYFVAEMINVGIAQKNVHSIVLIGLEMLAAAGFTALISLWGSYLCADLAARTGKHLRERIFEKAQMLSVNDFNYFGTASMITRSTGDITVIQEAMIMAAQMILPTPLILVAAVVMTAAASPTLLYIPLAAMLLFLLVAYLLFRKARPISAIIQKRVDAVNQVVRESILGIRVIRAFDNTEYERQRADDAFSEYADNMIRLNRTYALFNPVVWVVMGIAMAAVVWVGGFLVLQQTIQVGSIVAISEYTVIMLVFLMMSAMVLEMIPRVAACLERIREVLDTVPGIADLAVTYGQLDTGNTQKIEFQNVSFSYKGAEEPVLEALSFKCEQGKTTAIIGGTGSGKSTIAALMLRLYDVQDGRILLEGKDIRGITQHDLREHIGYVPQKAFLFSGTITDNLLMGNKNATLKELRRAARIAQADSFISSLEQGYDSLVAQGGTNFSGGQKQRLCIARALVKKSPVYLFDDSFSALDYKTDAALRNALKHEMRDAAVVIIAQRISTILDADQIIVLDAGKIAGIGRHDELIENCGVYKEIAYSQLMEKEINRT
ncbi:ABC transporter ATP-binding protein [Desulfosporosinus sp. FKA]|uniref:ABC transporter ATP-binding protein n=1 Tax=Desulfosporosinus sp. FKA TaxID=1969834 RepID=UPI000B4A0028|nr:ABC transporter ATP-binding protein [Desulfosporosinus sp. FKA]